MGQVAPARPLRRPARRRRGHRRGGLWRGVRGQLARRRGGAGETIRYTVVSTWLGWALVATTERGICMTALGDNRASLEADLRRRFPAATLAPADAALSGWAERVV